MREIRFRGKRKNGTEMLIGDLNYINGQVYIFQRTPETPVNSPDWFEVDPETVGQFTGHIDKNGKEIFEGDIKREEIEQDNGDIRFYFVCVWIQEWSLFGWLSTNDSEYQDYIDNGAHTLDDVMFWTYGVVSDKSVVIGNIHDHPKYLDMAFLEANEGNISAEL